MWGLLVLLGLGCGEDDDGPPTSIGWWPDEAPSLVLTPTVAVVPRGDTISWGVETDAQGVFGLTLGTPPDGVTVIDLEDCCSGGAGTVELTARSDAPLATRPIDVTLTDTTGTVLTAASAHVSVVPDQSGLTLPVTAAIPAGFRPSRIKLGADEARAYVTNSGSQDLTVVALETMSATFPVDVAPGTAWPRPKVGEGPVDIAFGASPDSAYVVYNYADVVSIIDFQDSGPPRDVLVGKSPSAVATALETPLVYVANRGSNDVSVVDPSTAELLRTIPVGVGPTDLAVADEGLLYVVNWGSDDVSVIDLTRDTVVSTFAVGDRPTSIALAPDGSRALVTNSGTDDVSVIDLASHTVIASVPVGEGPAGAAIAHDASLAYVVCSRSDDLWILDVAGATVLDNVDVGREPMDAMLSPDGTSIFVVNAGTSDVYVLDRTSG